MEPDLSIVIPSHCRADLLQACLASVIQHAPPGTEIMVVDDGSPRAEVSRVARGFATVQIVRLPRQLGFCAAANRGIRRARGRIVELLNDDTEVTAGWASAALACFDDSSVGAVAPLVVQFNRNGNCCLRIDSAGDRYYLGGIARKRGHGEPLCDKFLQAERVFGASGSSAFYRRDVLLAIGLFPEPFGAYFEDVDVAFRLHWAGFEVRYEPASRVLHRLSSSHCKHSRRLLEQQSLNEERVFWRNMPAAWLSRALPRHAAVLAAKAWKRWDEGNLLAFLSGRMRIMADIGTLIRHRRRLPARTPNMAAWAVEREWHGGL